MDKVISSIHIDAPIEKVWDFLVNPEKTKLYMFGCETVSDWQIGSELNWKGSYEGQEMIFVTGIVKSFQPPHQLIYTTFDPNATYPNILENHTTVTYNLSESNGTTLLEVIQEGFENAADGQKRYEEVYNNGLGWTPLLEEIKKVVEA